LSLLFTKNLLLLFCLLNLFTLKYAFTSFISFHSFSFKKSSFSLLFCPSCQRSLFFNVLITLVAD
jgi:hypothetical protein